MPQTPPPAAARPLLSVVLPLLDERGLALECIGGWAREKAEVPLQLLVVSDGRRPALERRARGLLGPEDAFLLQEGGEAAMYDRACRAAWADLLLLTEAHCLPSPGAARSLVRFFDERAAEAAWLESGHLSPNRFARLEERLVEEDRRSRTDPDDWRHVSLRGFAVRKSVYLDAGGLRPELGRFAEAVLAVRIQRSGRKLHSVPGALVRHGNCETYSELSEALRAHGAAQAAYWERCERGEVERFHPPHPDWAGRGRLDRTAARELSRIAWASLFRDAGRPGRGERSGEVARVLPAILAAALLGPRPALWKARAAAMAVRARCLFARGDEHRFYGLYRRLWAALLRVGVLQEVLRQAPPTASGDGRSGAIDAGEIPDGAFAGFYGREDWAKKPCRWSAPVALARVRVPAGTYRVRLRAHFPWGAEESCLRLFWNGQPIPPRAVRPTADGVEFAPPGASPQDETQTIGIVCRPYLPRRSGSPDPRRLGLLLFATELTPALAAEAAPAFSRGLGGSGLPASAPRTS
ncbi:MAG: hypothetical protein ABR576_11700 [Thermoanaerobaculia bacterium]